MAEPKIVQEFIEFGKSLIVESLHASDDGFIDKEQAHEAVKNAWLIKHKEWAPELARLESSRTGDQPVYQNRLWWMTAELAGARGNPAKTEKATKRPFIALQGHLQAALTAYGMDKPKRIENVLDRDQSPSTHDDIGPPAFDQAFAGCFHSPSEVTTWLERLQARKNLILQGPPGTGKTWLAKRLAYALMGERDTTRLRAVQFHPNLSYEDFVRGWRPTANGLVLTDGIFVQTIKAALDNPEAEFVVVIEEINRGNPAHIFGELLTLLEDSKRTPDEALELCYPDPDDGNLAEYHPTRLYVPPNLYVIGTMNMADRSLAIVDTALRRRFAFVELEPQFNARWQTWVTNRCNIPPNLAGDIGRRINDLNQQIIDDPQLGKHFCIGHSYVTPHVPIGDGRAREWFRQVVDTEIGPQLAEAWFDRIDIAEAARYHLLEDW